MHYALVIGQAMGVVFLAFHDWVPLGKLNNVAGLRPVDTTNRLVFTTALSTLPFAAVLVVVMGYLPSVRVWHSSGVVDSLSRHSRSGPREALWRSLCGYARVFA
jgi:hypothetical protein